MNAATQAVLRALQEDPGPVDPRRLQRHLGLTHEELYTALVQLYDKGMAKMIINRAKGQTLWRAT